MPDLAQVPMLLVEDREADILIMRRAFEALRLPNPLQVVRDGEEAIQYLSGQGVYANRGEFPLPFLILLDLKLPKLDGFGVLRWLRSTPSLKHLLVVVLTSSDSDQDILTAYQSGANSYLVKPANPAHLQEMVGLLSKYWVTLNKIVEFRKAAREV